MTEWMGALAKSADMAREKLNKISVQSTKVIKNL